MTCLHLHIFRPPIRIHDFPSSPDNDEPSDPSADPRIPDYFHVAKEYIFKALEDDAFVRFIRAKAFCNLTRLGTFIRLFCGLFCLWAGFVVAFTLVFYDYKPKIRRLYVSPSARNPNNLRSSSRLGRIHANASLLNSSSSHSFSHSTL
jgi:hypothetical protein